MRRILVAGTLLMIAGLMVVAMLYDSRRATAKQAPAKVETAKTPEAAPVAPAVEAPKRAKISRDDLDRLGLLTAGITRLTATEQESAIRYDIRTRDLPEAARIEARKKHELGLIGVRAERDEKARERLQWAERIAGARQLDAACFVLLAPQDKAKACGGKLWGIGEGGEVMTAADPPPDTKR